MRSSQLTDLDRILFREQPHRLLQHGHLIVILLASAAPRPTPCRHHLRHIPRLCLHFLTSFCGSNPTGNIAPSLVPTVFKFLPAGTSVQVMSHWAQVRTWVNESQCAYALSSGGSVRDSWRR